MIFLLFRFVVWNGLMTTVNWHREEMITKCVSFLLSSFRGWGRRLSYYNCCCLLVLQLLVWNQHSTQPVLKYCEHTAAVKAIAWSPHLQGLLASGGGSADRCIRFWNTTTNTHLSCIDTGSQVMCLLLYPFSWNLG